MVNIGNLLATCKKTLQLHFKTWKIYKLSTYQTMPNFSRRNLQDINASDKN